MPTVAAPPVTRELNSRTQANITVKMLWTEGSDRVQISVEDHRERWGFCFSVPGHRANDAYDHPFVWVDGAPDAVYMDR